MPHNITEYQRKLLTEALGDPQTTVICLADGIVSPTQTSPVATITEGARVVTDWKGLWTRGS